MRPLLILLSCVVLLQVPAAGQPVAPVHGDRVRITATGVSGKFTVAEVRPDAWLLNSEDHSEPIVLPFSAIRRVAVLRGERSASAAAGRGALKGAGVGGIIMVLSEVALSSSGDPFVSSVLGDREVVYGGLIGGMALLGALFASGDREIWERVESPLNVGASPGGGATLTFSIRSGRGSARSDD